MKMTVDNVGLQFRLFIYNGGGKLIASSSPVDVNNCNCLAITDEDADYIRSNGLSSVEIEAEKGTHDWDTEQMFKAPLVPKLYEGNFVRVVRENETIGERATRIIAETPDSYFDKIKQDTNHVNDEEIEAAAIKYAGGRSVNVDAYYKSFKAGWQAKEQQLAKPKKDEAIEFAGKVMTGSEWLKHINGDKESGLGGNILDAYADYRLQAEKGGGWNDEDMEDAYNSGYNAHEHNYTCRAEDDVHFSDFIT